MPFPEDLASLERGIVDLNMRDDLVDRLKEGKPLRIKVGFDPTRPDLHLGHAVLLRKMRQFQDRGHRVIFVVGDFTAQIGDPSGRSATRPVPTRDEILEGARTYATQAFKILDRERTEVVYNSTWLGSMSFEDVIRLAGRYTLARMMERDDFKRRWAEHRSISLHELLYPLAQAYDSVHLACDLELGGTDQLFNLMVGREIMREMGLRPQIVMTTPILEGLGATMVDGKLVGDKMSKSLDNYIGVDEPPLEQFGKLMSISDDLMWRYYELLSDRTSTEVAERKASCASGANPRDAKLDLASEIVERFHDRDAASDARERWLAQFSRRQVPDEMPEKTLEAADGSIPLAKAIALAGLVKSNSEGRRRIAAGAVEVDGERIVDEDAQLARGRRYVVKAGKRAWAAIEVV